MENDDDYDAMIALDQALLDEENEKRDAQQEYWPDDYMAMDESATDTIEVDKMEVDKQQVMIDETNNPTIVPVVQKIIDNVQRFDQCIDIVVSELAIMGPALTTGDAIDIINTVLNAVGGRITTEGIRNLKNAMAEWLNRFPDLTIQQKIDMVENMSRALRIDCSRLGCVEALSKLWENRKKCCAIHIDKNNILAKSETDSEVSAEFFLRTVDRQLTHVYSLVLHMRLFWPTSHEITQDFVLYDYSDELACGLKNNESFDKVWNTEHHFLPKDAFMSSVTRYVDIQLSHEFIKKYLSALLGENVFQYEKTHDYLLFSLDDGNPIDRQMYRLHYKDGQIKNKQKGVLHNLYGDVRQFIVRNGSIESMADLVVKNGFGDIAKFDAEINSYRIYNANTGVWDPPRIDNAENAVRSHLSRFIAKILRPIESFTSFMGSTFDWMMGTFDSEICETDDASQTIADESASTSTVGNKRQKLSITPSQKSIANLRAVIYKFTESVNPRNEVLSTLQNSLVTDFSRLQPYLLPCINGMVDLRTKELRPIVRDDLVTWVCATAYDPHVDTTAALKFYESFLPKEPGAYPDRDELIKFISEWMGYSISGETNLEMCVYFYGVGSNSKSTQSNLNTLVLGKTMCKTIPMEAICKKKGENNDSLHDAFNVRVVMINEGDKSLKIHESAFRSLVSCEETKSKTMYKREKDVKPSMKITMFVNNLPVFEDKSNFCTSRRNVYFPLRKIFVDRRNAADRKEIEEYRRMKLPECLIGDKDTSFFEKYVQGSF
jgi:D5 N terminal like